MNKKVKTQTQLLKIVTELKKKRKKIVVFNGSFDLLHLGHIKSIAEAKQQGDVLIILLNSDVSVKKYKGPNRPIITEIERTEILSALTDVDYITLFDDINPKNILGQIKPDIYCKGLAWGKNCIEREIIEKSGGKIFLLKQYSGFSSSSIIQRLLKLSKPVAKAVFLDRDGVINDNKKGYIHEIEDFEFSPNAISALKKLSQSQYKVIIVTNQSGIGRKYYTKKDFLRLNNYLLKKLKEKKIKIKKVYYCPHQPQDNCQCRKPKIGMLLDAVEELSISLKDSWIIGDSERDVIMGREANVKTIKIGAKMPSLLKLEPNYYAAGLLEAVNIILGDLP